LQLSKQLAPSAQIALQLPSTQLNAHSAPGPHAQLPLAHSPEHDEPCWQST
jgi:hypothetical protein